ncbi:MAG: hypothetical protein JXR78_16625 [Victivallales bacterium]|nr:hypothetical protein [Victivallales bacterium]
MNINHLHNKIAAVANINGVSIGNETDKATWQVSYAEQPTPEQVAQVQTIIDAYSDESAQAEMEAPFVVACEQFRNVCGQIATAMNVAKFKGGFDEMIEFQSSQVSATADGMRLALAWSAANELCKYEGGKIGLGQPAWWYRCWELA